MKISFGRPAAQVSPLVYGQFIEHILNCIEGGIYDPQSPLADETGLRTDVVEKLAQMAPAVLRFPGGTIMCQYHWQDAVGPAEERKRRMNRIWGGELDPAFGTAEFISLCRRVGAEPMICVNMASGTPEEAASWVEYCNGTGHTYYADLRRSHGYEEPFGVKYWCIGNECYAEPDIGLQHDPDVYCREAMEFIKWMKLTDRSIQTLAVTCDDENWNRKVVSRLGNVVDYLSYHHYSAEGDMGLYGPFAGEKALRAAISRLKALADECPDTVTDFSPWYRFPPRQGKMRIALDEWNIWDFRADATYGLLMRYNWRDALWTASVLNLLISEERVGMANLAQSVNVLAPIVTEKDGCWEQTIAWAWKLYRSHMAGRRVECRFQPPVLDGGRAGEIEAISLSCVQREDGARMIAAVNRDFEREYLLEMEESVSAEIIRLAADSPRDTCSRERCCVHETHETAQGKAIPLPAGSISMIIIHQEVHV